MSHGHCQCLKPEILSLCFKIVTQPHGQLSSNYEKSLGSGHDMGSRCIEEKTGMPTPMNASGSFPEFGSGDYPVRGENYTADYIQDELRNVGRVMLLQGRNIYC